jgi:predicted Zn-dependent peptidase
MRAFFRPGVDAYRQGCKVIRPDEDTRENGRLAGPDHFAALPIRIHTLGRKKARMFYERSVTPGGVTVITERMAGFRSAAIGIWVAAGSRDELPGEAGVSHFVEHMMFKGTPTRSAAEISEAFDRIGARFNAGTDKEYTTYYCQVIDQHAVEAFSILADMVSHSLMEEPAVLSEREVVLEEISRSEDQPDDMVHDLFASTLFPGHPIGRPVLGSPGATAAATSSWPRPATSTTRRSWRR